MIYLIFGNDLKKSREKLNSLVAQLLKKGDKNSFFEFGEDDFDESEFNTLYKTPALFSFASIIVLRRHFSVPVLADFHLSNLDKYNDCEHRLLFWEEELDKQYKKAFKKYKDRILEFNFKYKKEIEKEKGDKRIFQICDAFARRTRHDSWVIYRKLLAEGVSVDDIFWKIFWQVKTLLSIKENDSQGLHPFVYQKNKKNADRFSTNDLKKFLSELTDLFHKSRFSGNDLEIGLEKILLKV